MNKRSVLGLVLSLAIAIVAPVYGQGVIKKVEDKTKDAASATATETKKVAGAAEKDTKKAAKATEKGATTAAKDTKVAAEKTGEATKNTAENVGSATAKGAKKVADSNAGQTTEKAAKTVGKDTAKGAEKVGGAVAGAATATGKEVKKVASKPATASDADIKAAQASGKVWVNTDSGVYHKSGAYYGKTKEGKFMTEAEAQKAGYRVAK